VTDLTPFTYMSVQEFDAHERARRGEQHADVAGDAGQDQGLRTEVLE
jgi:hypothetical protein